MRFPRISVAKSAVHCVEEVDGDYATLWLLPHHGFFPTEEIARAVARTHQCDDSGIRPLQFVRSATSEGP